MSTIFEVAQVDSFRRVGYRVQAVLPVDDMLTASRRMRRRLFSDQINDLMGKQAPRKEETFDLLVQWTEADLTITLRTQPVELVAGTESRGERLPPTGLMIDPDIHVDQLTTLKGLKPFLHRAEQWVETGLPDLRCRFISEE